MEAKKVVAVGMHCIFGSKEVTSMKIELIPKKGERESTDEHWTHEHVISFISLQLEDNISIINFLNCLFLRINWNCN